MLTKIARHFTDAPITFTVFVTMKKTQQFPHDFLSCKFVNLKFSLKKKEKYIFHEILLREWKFGSPTLLHFLEKICQITNEGQEINLGFYFRGVFFPFLKNYFHFRKSLKFRKKSDIWGKKLLLFDKRKLLMILFCDNLGRNVIFEEKKLLIFGIKAIL